MQTPQAPSSAPTESWVNWLRQLAMRESGLIMLFLLLPGGYLAVYCHAEHIPFPVLGAGLGLFLGLITLFLILTLLVLSYIALGPALIAAAIFPSKAHEREKVPFTVTLPTFTWWIGVPLGASFGLIILLSLSDRQYWHWLWLVVLLVACMTSYGLSRASQETWRFRDLAALSFGLLLCALLGLLLYAPVVGRLVDAWPGWLQWVALTACFIAHCYLMYVLLKLPEAVRRQGLRTSLARGGIVLLGLSLLGLLQPDISGHAIRRALQFVQRGGGEQVELVMDAQAAYAEGLLSGSPVAPLVRCRAQLLLDFGEETSVRFEGQTKVSTMRVGEYRRMLRETRSRSVDTTSAESNGSACSVGI